MKYAIGNKQLFVERVTCRACEDGVVLQYTSYGTVMLRICRDCGIVYADTKFYSKTTSEHQDIIADLEPDYKTALYVHLAERNEQRYLAKNKRVEYDSIVGTHN